MVTQMKRGANKPQPKEKKLRQSKAQLEKIEGLRFQHCCILLLVGVSGTCWKVIALSISTLSKHFFKAGKNSS